jgi:hypothetical protein
VPRCELDASFGDIGYERGQVTLHGASRYGLPVCHRYRFQGA